MEIRVLDYTLRGCFSSLASRNPKQLLYLGFFITLDFQIIVFEFIIIIIIVTTIL
jgi:hypothetical protein